MNKTQILEKMSRAKATGAWTVKRVLPAGAYPWNDYTAERRFAAFATAFQVKEARGKAYRHVVVGARITASEVDWGVWCGDHFLEGDNKATASIEFPNGFALKVDVFTEEMESREGVLAQSKTKCDFWENHSCEHVDEILAYLGERPEVLDEIEELWRGALPEVKSSNGDVAWDLPRAHLFTLPVLLMGDRGAGKTFLSRSLAEEVDAEFFELGFHAETKVSSILGRMVLNQQGAFAWVDGPLTRAFRLAKRGQRVLVLLDELLRAPQEQLSALLTALSPTRAGTYRLSTGRIIGYDEDGVGVEEVLEAPIRNIAVVATTNVGAEYSVCDIDPALQERFFVVKMDTTEEMLQTVLSEIARRKQLPQAVVARLIAFWKGMTAMVKNGVLSRAPTLRVLSRALERARRESELRASVLAEKLQWVELDSNGEPVPEHLKAIEKAANAASL